MMSAHRRLRPTVRIKLNGKNNAVKTTPKRNPSEQLQNFCKGPVGVGIPLQARTCAVWYKRIDVMRCARDGRMTLKKKRVGQGSVAGRRLGGIKRGGWGRWRGGEMRRCNSRRLKDGTGRVKRGGGLRWKGPLLRKEGLGRKGGLRPGDLLVREDGLLHGRGLERQGGLLCVGGLWCGGGQLRVGVLWPDGRRRV